MSKTSIEQLAVPDPSEKTTDYFDTAIKGFGVRAGRRRKSYTVMRRCRRIPYRYRKQLRETDKRLASRRGKAERSPCRDQRRATPEPVRAQNRPELMARLRAPRPKTGDYIYDFEIEGISAMACVIDAGWDELCPNIILWPTPEARRWIICANVLTGCGAEAGQVVASGWLERQDGIYLQPQTSLLYCKRERMALVFGLKISPRGYKDRGLFRL
ncbi:hypothetical protein [Bosea sp. 2RAB26]|uniref:hypothetical protein n=1 Tax=Bosea sp. 2RAB26 TaxID=3237476 RepID=UPI003F8F0B21